MHLNDRFSEGRTLVGWRERIALCGTRTGVELVIGLLTRGWTTLDKYTPLAYC